MDLLTDFPERLRAGLEVFVGEVHEALVIRSIRPKAAGMIVAFEGFNDRDIAGRLRNTTVYIPTAGLPVLADGEYYHHELLGLNVVTEDGEKVGSLVEILETGANDVYVVQPESGKEILLPAIDDVILHVDLEQKTMQVRLQDWS